MSKRKKIKEIERELDEEIGKVEKDNWSYPLLIRRQEYLLKNILVELREGNEGVKDNWTRKSDIPL